MEHRTLHIIIILSLILLLQIHRKGTYKMPIWHCAHLIIISEIIIMVTWGSPLRAQGLKNSISLCFDV